MINRSKTTDTLSKLVEKRLNSQRMYWSPEVDFDKGTPKYKRIDYVGFKPYTPDYEVEATSVELGDFVCYEVKSCMQDFESGNGLTFYGDHNYLVCTLELAEQLQKGIKIPRQINGVLVPNKSLTSLYLKFDFGINPESHRRRTASEMLWEIVKSHDRLKRLDKEALKIKTIINTSNGFYLRGDANCQKMYFTVGEFPKSALFYDDKVVVKALPFESHGKVKKIIKIRDGYCVKYATGKLLNIDLEDIEYLEEQK